MNKFKKILLGTLSVLTLGLFVVTGTKVNATVTNGTYYALASDFMPNDTYAEGTKVENLFTIAGSFSDDSSNAIKSNYYGGQNSQKTGTAYTKGLKSGSASGRTVTLDLTSTQTAAVTVYAYSTSNSRSVTIGTETTSMSKEAVVATGTLTSANNVITLYCAFVEIKAVITTAATYSLSYVSQYNSINVGTAPTAQNNITSITSEMISSISADGYRFDGWFYDNGTWANAVKAGDSLSKDTTIYAKWTDLSDVWNVSFKKNSTDVKDYAIAAVAKGEAIGSENWPAEPRVLNKNFGGWFDGDTEYTSSTEINGDLTLVAKFNELKNDLVVFGDYTTGLSDVKGEEITDEYTIIDGIVATGSSNKKFGSKSYTIGDVSFNGTTNSNKFIQCGELSFTLTKTSMVTFYGTQTNDSNAQTTHVINTTTNETVMSDFVVSTKVSDSSNVRDSFSVTLPAGTYKTVQSGLLNWYGIRVNQDIKAADTTVTVDADKSTDGDTIRFMGTLAGITDVDNIDSIQLLLSKDGVKAKKDIYFTTVYRSVKGKYAAADNTYYVIFALKDVKDVTGTFNFDVKVLFTDGSYTVNEVQGTYVA